MSATTEERAKQSLGTSGRAIYEMAAAALAGRHPGGGTLLDVGCGRGEFWPFVKDRFAQYVGADVVRHDGFPAGGEFHAVDLDTGRVPLPDGAADVVAAVETIEHLENPRAFARELTRLARPGGWVVVTTPNQLSWLSKMSLVVKNNYPAFAGNTYPAHLTALLEIDLRRIAGECGWTEVAVAFSKSGRLPGVAWHWPRWASAALPRALSDNVLILGRAPLTPTRGGHEGVD